MRREHPQLKPIYEQMDHLRQLLKHKRQLKRQCKGHIKALLEAIDGSKNQD